LIKKSFVIYIEMCFIAVNKAEFSECHKILQISFYVDLLLKKHFLIIIFIIIIIIIKIKNNCAAQCKLL